MIRIGLGKPVVSIFTMGALVFLFYLFIQSFSRETERSRSLGSAGLKDVGARFSSELNVGPCCGSDREKTAMEVYGQLPLRFEANLGQLTDRVQFSLRGSSYMLFLTPGEAVLSLLSSSISTLVDPHSQSNSNPQRRRFSQAVVRLEFIDANLEAPAEGSGQLPGFVNYFTDSDPQHWHADIPTYARVRYRQFYPGVDLVYYGSQNRNLEYDFILAPGANPSNIKIRIGGVESLSLNPEGDLELAFPGGGQLIQRAPTIFQKIDEKRRPVEGGYKLLADNVIGFEISSYDQTQPLVIDPELIYSTYLGGLVVDAGNAVDVDEAGQAFITGATFSNEFPVDDAFQPSLAAKSDAFVTKLDADGVVLFSTYLGGEQSDHGADIAVGIDGSAFITGSTTSPDFPTMNPLDGTHNGQQDAFVTRLNPAGNALIFSTFHGGTRADQGFGVALDSDDNAYVTGYTSSSDFPTLDPLQAENAGEADVFVSKFQTDGAAMVYSTYFGGSGDDGFLPPGAVNGVPRINCRIAVHKEEATITGTTFSDNFPTLNPLQAGRNGFSDAFVARLASDGGSLLYSTFLGGSDRDIATDIAVDDAGNAYVIGTTRSNDFPHTVGVIQNTFGGGGNDAFVARVATDGSALLYSTYLGGTGADTGNGIGIDADGNATITGQTTSTDFPIQDPLQALNGTTDAYVATLSVDASSLLFSTYLGGSANEVGQGVAVDKESALYITGHTNSDDYPTISPFQADFAGEMDAFVTKLADVDPVYAYEYVAKIVCGLVEDPEDMRLTRGYYATTINVHSPGKKEARFFKKLALTYPPGGQQPGKIYPIAEDILQEDEALAVDCLDIRERLFPEPNNFPAPYIEGFIVIQSTASLDVTAVYTTSALDASNNVSAHSSIDVEKVPERSRQVDLAITKKAAHLCGIVSDQIQICLILYEIVVSNNGPNDAFNVEVADELRRTGNEGGFLIVDPTIFQVLPDGEFTVINQTGQISTMKIEIPEIPSGAATRIRFVALSTNPSDTPHILIDTASVFSDEVESNSQNNTFVLQTELN